MKTLFIITSFIGLCVSIHFKILNLKLSNELKIKSDTISRLRVEKYVRDNKMMNVDVLIQNEKIIKRVKNYYFQN